MSKNQILFWKALILLSSILGIACASLWLLNGNVRSLLTGAVLLVCGAGMSVVLRRSTRSRKH